MGIEELEKELKELKAFAYDLNGEYAKLTQRIDAITNEIVKLKENGKETVIQSEEAIQVSTPEAEVVQPVETPVQEETTEAVVQVPEVNIPEDSTVIAPVVESTENLVQEETTEAVVSQENVPVQEETTEPVIETPVIQPVVTEVQAEVPGPQALDQTPLTPTGVEIPNVQEQPAPNNVYKKTDGGTPRAILISADQGAKLRSSKELNKGLVFGEQTVVTPVVGESAPATEAVVESKDEINKQLEAMYEELRTITDEEKANEINNQISVLTKKLGEAA